VIGVVGCCYVGGFGNCNDVGGLTDGCVVVCGAGGGGVTDDNTASFPTFCTRVPCMCGSLSPSTLSCQQFLLLEHLQIKLVL